MKTFAALKLEVRNAIWPESEAENLILAHNGMVEAALAEIQKWVECERDHNVNVFPHCSTLFKCGMTVFDMPDGIIRRVYTIANGDWCDPVFYRQKDWPEPEKLARNFANYVLPNSEGFPVLPQGFRFAEASSDYDSQCGRARTGIWALWNKRLYLFPWIQSNEAVIVEWKGIKKTWADEDLVNEDIDFRECVKLYVQYAHERDFGSPSQEKRFKELYDRKLADLMHECRERTMRRNDLDYDDSRNRLPSELQDDAAPTPAEVVFAHMGNYATDSASETAISNLVRSWWPKFLLASGQNTVAGDYDNDVGKYFHDFIFPYSGDHGNGAALNMFWPAPGFKDWEVAPNDLSAFTSFFKLPNNERYYELVRGDVHFFFIDTDDREADGITAGSTQGLWLEAKLALSTAVWKVVIMSKPPFSSGVTTGSEADLQWPFESWGANLVIAGEAGLYERITVGGISYIVNGLGGAANEEIEAVPVAGSVIQYREEFGALKFIASSQALTVEFWNRYGIKIDSFSMTV